MKSITCGKAKGLWGTHIHPYWKRVAAKAERRNEKIRLMKEMGRS